MADAPAIHAAVACNLDADILAAAYPLLAKGQVGALEWSFDTLFALGEVPEWFETLLDTYGQAGRLVGHGVYFSLLSGRWTAGQQQWLAQLQQLAARFCFDHVTEHFGFFTGQNFHHGAPLPVPYSPAALRLGQDRLARIHEACQCPVGLENLAFAYSLAEVERHGEFLDELLTPVNGFIILDLHNLYCQLHNFAVPYEELIGRYPLARVREIHISGGSWEKSKPAPGGRIRRDTHDGAVPAEVFELLALTLPRCPNLKYVVLEQLGGSLQTEHRRRQFRRDFSRMQALVQAHTDGRPAGAANSFRPAGPVGVGPVAEDEQLHQQQRELARILENAPSYEDARRQLLASGLAGSDWQVESWEPHLLATAVNIARKWKQ